MLPSRTLGLSAGVAFILTSLIVYQGRARADTLVSPGGDASVEGNYNNAFPFFIAAAGHSSMRYQQVYSSADFAAARGPIFITQIAFRPDGTFGQAFSTTLPNVQIDFSTTTASPDGLSNRFASNVGVDDTIVHSGALTLSSSDTGPPGGPKDFDVVVGLTTPFRYDPSKGNLLLDVRNFGGGTGGTPLDAEKTSGDAVSRVFTLPSSGVNLASGFTDTVGLVTQFTFESAAAPLRSTFIYGSALLAGVGIFQWPLRRRFSAR